MATATVPIVVFEPVSAPGGMIWSKRIGLGLMVCFFAGENFGETPLAE